MKRRIIFALLALLLPLFALAQKGLHANAAFTGQIVPQDQTVEVKVRGRALSAYRLTFYHSVRFKANAQQKSTMDNLVEKDKAQHWHGTATQRSYLVAHPLPATTRADPPLSVLPYQRQ